MNQLIKNKKLMKNGFNQCAENHMHILRKENRYATAHVYENAVKSINNFFDKPNLPFDLINKDNLRKYEQFLKNRQCKPNTISTYMRAVRCVYNRGVEAGDATYIPRLFRDVYTGVESAKKKAVQIVDLQTLLQDAPKSAKLRKIQTYVNLMFQFCGMPFADLSHLQQYNIQGDTLEYQRKKTGTPMKIEVLDDAKEMISELKSKNGDKYLFPFLSGTTQGEDEYREYQTALCKFNRELNMLAAELGIEYRVTSYSIRHSFATSLKYRKVPIEMISELLGHKSIKTTQIYLKSFAMDEHTKINKSNYKYVCGYKAASGRSKGHQLLNR